MSKLMDAKCRNTYRLLNQGEVWFPKGRPRVAIADMDPEWRFNTARFLERRAAVLELLYSMGELGVLGEPTMQAVVGEVWGETVTAGPLFSHLDLLGEHASDAFDQELERRVGDPVAWLRTTPLYQALVAGLPRRGKRLAALAERARHWSTCPARTGTGDCLCDDIRAAAAEVAA